MSSCGSRSRQKHRYTRQELHHLLLSFKTDKATPSLTIDQMCTLLKEHASLKTTEGDKVLIVVDPSLCRIEKKTTLFSPSQIRTRGLVETGALLAVLEGNTRRIRDYCDALASIMSSTSTPSLRFDRLDSLTQMEIRVCGNRVALPRDPVFRAQTMDP